MKTSEAMVKVVTVKSTLEPYMVEKWNDVLPIDACGADALRREAAQYRALGFMQLGANYDNRADALESKLGLRLTAEELSVWAWRYPTIYSTSGPYWLSREIPEFGNSDALRWADLRWPVPEEVRALIPEARRVYESLEIWVPELHRAGPVVGLSPILVGRLGSGRFLLARWAEALEPFEEIRARAFSPEGREALAIRLRVGDSRDRPVLIVLMTLTALGSASLFSLGLAWMQNPAHAYVVRALPFLASGLLGVACRYVAREVWRRSQRALRWACEYAGWVVV